MSNILNLGALEADKIQKQSADSFDGHPVHLPALFDSFCLLTERWSFASITGLGYTCFITCREEKLTNV